MLRFIRSCALVTVLVVPLMAVEVGDTLAAVLEEKGQPAGKMEAGGAVVLRYADKVITVREGKVASLKPVTVASANPKAPPTAPTTPAPKRAPATVPASWSTDYNAALARAQAENRKVFLFFTGSDWCGWCKRLDREILSTRDFVNYAAEELVLVKLDFPRGFQLPAEVAEANKRLAARYRIRGYPTVIVLNPAGQAVGRLGYQDGGPQPFIGALRKL